jgi:hypothetical protein
MIFNIDIIYRSHVFKPFTCDQFARFPHVITWKKKIFLKKFPCTEMEHQKKNIRSLQGGALGLALSRCKKIRTHIYNVITWRGRNGWIT